MAVAHVSGVQQIAKLQELRLFEDGQGSGDHRLAREGETRSTKAFAAACTNFTDAQWRNGRHLVMGERGMSEWTFTGTAPDGQRSESDGVDLFTFKDGKILVKNVFRKARPLLPAV